MCGGSSSTWGWRTKNEERSTESRELTMRGDPLTVPSSFSIFRSPAPVGLLAGAGRFPILFAEKARSLNIPVVCVGIRYMASPELSALAQRFYWTGVARMGRMIRFFKREGVEQVVMAGRVYKTSM